MGQVEIGRLDQPPLGADALKEHQEVKAEEDNGVDGGTPTIGVAVLDPVADEGQIEGGVEMTVEVIGGNEVFQRD